MQSCWCESVKRCIGPLPKPWNSSLPLLSFERGTWQTWLTIAMKQGCGRKHWTTRNAPEKEPWRSMRRVRTLNTGRIEEGLQAHQEALRIFEEQHNTQGMAETLDLLGITYGMRGDRVKAVEQLGQAIALFRTLGDTQSLLSSLAMRAVQSMPGSSETTVCPLRSRNACVQDALESRRLAGQIDSLAGRAFAEHTLA